jgi:hypothetical protein
MTTIPSPKQLLDLAAQQPSRFDIEDYWASLVTLRQRGWSWREISEWLKQNGLSIDHTAVFRFAKNNEAVRLACLPEAEFKSDAHDILTERSAEIEGSEEFGAAIGSTNCCGFEIEEFDIGERKIEGDDLRFEASFTATGEQLDDRPYSGNRIKGTVDVFVGVDGTIRLGEISAACDVDPDDFDE